MISDGLPTIVEFVGLPGAGKTTTSRLLAERLVSDGENVVLRNEIFARHFGRPWLERIGAVATSGVRIKRAAYYGLFCPLSPHKWSKRLRGPFQVADYFVGIERTVESVAKSTLIVLEDWIVQSLWRACCIGACQVTKSKQLIAYHTATFNMSYVFIDIDPRTAATRIYERARRRRAGLDTAWTSYEHLEMEECVSLLGQRAEILSEMMDSIRARHVNVLHIDGRSRPEESSRRIRHWLGESELRQAATSDRGEAPRAAGQLAGL